MCICLFATSSLIIASLLIMLFVAMRLARLVCSKAALAATLTAVASLLGCGSTPAETSSTRPVSVTGGIITSAQVGTLPGAMTVGTDGSGNYTIPIEVPPGRLGMQPALSLTYSSRAGNGLLGVGWSVTGTSQITRCGSNYAHDGRTRAVKIDGQDNFCLDGVRLVGVARAACTTSATCSANEVCNGGGCVSEFHTDPDSFVKATIDSIDTEGPASWTVRASNGLVHHFGTTTDSRLDPGGALPRRVGWSLSRTEDRDGNYISYSYTTIGFAPLLTHRPLKIEYTASPSLSGNRRIEFCYDEGGARPDNMSAWLGGVGLVTVNRLTSIVEKAPAAPGGTIDATPCGGTVVRKYKLGYEQSQSTGRSRLHSVQLCDQAAACLPSTTFTYVETLPTFAAMPPERVDRSDTAHAFNGNADNLFFADYDGDGADDLMYYSTSAGMYSIRLANKPGTGAGFGPVLPQPSIGKNPLGVADLPHFLTASRTDVSWPDGAADLYDDGSHGVAPKAYFATFNSSGFAGMDPVSMFNQFFTDPFLAQGTLLRTRQIDMIGDGLPNYVFLKATNASPGIGVAVNIGNFEFPETANGHASSGMAHNYAIDFFRDIDGDGVQDIFASFAKSTDAQGNPVYGYDVIHTRATPSNGIDVEVDLEPFPSITYNTSQTTCEINADCRTEIGEHCTAGKCTDSSQANWLGCDVWLDLNGDHLPDIVRLRPGLASLIELNTGHGFMELANRLPSIPNDYFTDLHCKTTGADAGYRIADYNGDGADDIVFLALSSTKPITSMKNDNTKLQVLSASFDSLGLPTMSFLEDNSALPSIAGGPFRAMANLVDVNGDGLYDVFLVNSSSPASYQLYVQQGGPNDLLTQAVNGTGARARVDYANVLAMPSYTKTGPRYPNRTITSAVYAVSNEWIDDGTSCPDPVPATPASQCQVIAHDYADGRVDLQGNGFLGFNQHTTTDSRTARITTTRYNLTSGPPPAAATTTRSFTCRWTSCHRYSKRRMHRIRRRVSIT